MFAKIFRAYSFLIVLYQANNILSSTLLFLSIEINLTLKQKYFSIRASNVYQSKLFVYTNCFLTKCCIHVSCVILTALNAILFINLYDKQILLNLCIVTIHCYSIVAIINKFYLFQIGCNLSFGRISFVYQK